MNTFNEDYEAAGIELAEDNAASNAQLAESELKLARLRGQVEQVYENFRTDPEHVELIRQRAWGRTGAPITIENDRLVGAPDGWPAGTDEETFMDEWIVGQMAQHNEPSVHINEPVSPAVKRFREMLG